MAHILGNKPQAPVGRNVSRWRFYNFDAPASNIWSAGDQCAVTYWRSSHPRITECRLVPDNNVREAKLWFLANAGMSHLIE